MTWREFWARLTERLGRRDRDSELDEEIAHHLELARQDNLRCGTDPAEAHRLAALKFGGVDAAKEGVWNQRGIPGAGALIQDSRYALRGVWRNPGHALATVATIALGIGLCAVIFSIVNTYLLRPLPAAADPGRLAAIQSLVPYPYFERYRDEGGAVLAAAAFIGPVPFNVVLDTARGEQPERLSGHLVSLEYFATMGVQPFLGRFFSPELDHRGTAPVVVTERFWRTRLAADPAAAGRTLRINGHAAVIVGVSPVGFFGAGTGPGNRAELFVPVTAGPAVAPELAGDILQRTTQPAFRVILRLAREIKMAAAEARLDTETRRLDQELGNRDANRAKKGRVVTLMAAGHRVPLPDEVRSMILVFYGLLIALILSLMCANLAGLSLARDSARAKEIAIRLSLGASRFRLIRQLLTESALLACVGGAGGLAASYGLLAVVAAPRSGTGPNILDMPASPDPRVAVFSFLLSLAAAAGFGLIPALATTRPDLVSALKGSVAGVRAGGRPHGFGLRNLFVVWQLAAAMVLVLVMSLVILGVRYGVKRDPGFDPAPIYLFSLDPARDGLRPEERDLALTRLRDRLVGLAGVEGVTFAPHPPVRDSLPNASVSVPAGDGGAAAVYSVVLDRAGPWYFATLGAPVLQGAEFGERDFRTRPESGAVVPVVINRTAAETFFEGGPALGRIIEHWPEGESPRILQVAGVVSYDRPAAMMKRPASTVFLPVTVQDIERGAEQGITMVLRTRSQIDPAAVRHEAAAVDSRLTVFEQQTLRDYLALAEASSQIVTAFYLPVGLFALTLACVGVAGVTARSVQGRRKELSIRIALGARGIQVVGLVMREGTLLVAAGAAIGYGGAFALSRILAAAWAPMGEILALGEGNSVLIAGVPVLLVSLAIAACYVPARQASATDPLAILREQ